MVSDFLPFRIPFKREITRKLSVLRNRVGLQFVLINFHTDTNPCISVDFSKGKKKGRLNQIEPNFFFFCNR